MDDVYARVDEELSRKGRTWAWLARELEVTDQVVQNWKHRRVPPERYSALADALDWTLEQLIGKEPSPSFGGVNEPSAPRYLEYAGRPRTSTRVPVVGTARLGGDGYYNELEKPAGHGDGYVEAFSNDANAYAVRVKGDSMHPTIKHGQIVVVEPNGQLVPGENVLIALRDGRKMVKELVTGRPDSVTVVSVNGAERHTFERSEIDAIHAVAMIVSASKWRPE